MGWREMANGCGVEESVSLVDVLRRWLLIVMLAWVAGWQMMDMMLQEGVKASAVAAHTVQTATLAG